MSTALLIALIVVAAAACPLHMWWQQRRGRRAVCCPPPRRQHEAADIEALHARQQELGRQLALVRDQAAAEPHERQGDPDSGVVADSWLSRARSSIRSSRASSSG